MPYFEFIGEDLSRKSATAEKYWEITQVGKNVTVRFGKIGADGQLKVKEFDTKEEAEAAIPQVEVNRNHRVFRISDGEWADPAAGKEWLAQMNAHYANPDGVPKPEGERPKKIGEEFAISRVVGDRKRPVVVGGFKTREEASEYMKNNPEEIIEHKFPRYETYAFLDHVERQGPKVRDGNVSVKKDNNAFQKTFSFRGGVFGNWQPNKDGQTSLNHAYDALHDLTSAIGLPPKAAALDGTLAIGFGADGTGGRQRETDRAFPARRHHPWRQRCDRGRTG